MASLAGVVAAPSGDRDSGSDEVMPIARLRVELKLVKRIPLRAGLRYNYLTDYCVLMCNTQVRSLLNPAFLRFPGFLGGQPQIQSFVLLSLIVYRPDGLSALEAEQRRFNPGLEI
jgi:hypothetical protein